jgi:hypothetical protein
MKSRLLELSRSALNEIAPLQRCDLDRLAVNRDISYAPADSHPSRHRKAEFIPWLLDSARGNVSSRRRSF